MDRFIKKTKDLIFAQQGGIFSSALIISTMIVISSMFGFLRYRILAGYFTKEELDIYFAAFRIPDLIFEILITGALTTSFIPVIIKYQKNKEELDQHVSSIFNLLMITLSIIVIVLFFCMDFIIPLVTPGFKGEKLSLVIMYSKILLISQLPFLVAGNVLTGIAQAKKTFLITAAAPVLYNLAVIISTLLFTSTLHLLAPVLGVAAGAVIFFVIQLPVLLTFNINYRLIIKYTDGVRDFFKLIGPRILTVIVSQIDATIDLSLTSLLGSGAYTVFYFAQHLQLLPVSVVGIAFGQASLPYLSELYEQNKIEDLKNIIIDSLLKMLFFAIPVAFFFIFARTPLIRIFFGGEKFDWDATVQTAYALSYFALSLPFHTVYYFITRCFYALLDSKTPFIISLLTVTINTLLSLYFVLVAKLPIWSLAISFSLSVVLNTTVLFVLLVIKLKNIKLTFFITETAKIIMIAFIATPPAYYLIKLMDNLLLDTTRSLNVFLLLASSAIAYFLLYLILAWFFNIKEMYAISHLFTRAKMFQKKILEITSYDQT